MAMANQLLIQVIFEGGKIQVEFLREVGYDMAQGVLLRTAH